VGYKNADFDRYIKRCKKSVSDAKRSGKAFKLFRKRVSAKSKSRKSSLKEEATAGGERT
jgi:hypothetical protein